MDRAGDSFFPGRAEDLREVPGLIKGFRAGEIDRFDPVVEIFLGETHRLEVLVVITGVALYINSISGVVRDVPELDTYKGKTTDRMHIAYNEAPYKMNKNFSTDDKLHVLVIGNSFGRDWFNILKEMNLDDQVELSYLVDSYKNYDKYENRKDYLSF